MSLKVAQSFARVLYEQLLAQTQPASAVFNPPKVFTRAKVHSPESTFGQLAEDMYLAEKARTERSEFARGSLQVLRNRLDAHILPRWRDMPMAQVGYPQLMAFLQDMSVDMSTITLSQYFVAISKVFNHAFRMGVIKTTPEFPKVKIKTQSREAFTPTEYWRILRTARSLRGNPPPLIASGHCVKITNSFTATTTCRPIWLGPWVSWSTALFGPAI